MPVLLATSPLFSSMAPLCDAGKMPTAMRMGGFQWFHPQEPCVVFFATNVFVVDTNARLAGAIALTLLMGAMTGICVYLRSRVRTTVASRTLASTLSASLFGIQVTTGYLLMLLVMTYQLELFIAVVVAVVLGFVIAEVAWLPAVDCCTTTSHNTHENGDVLDSLLVHESH